MAWTKAMRNHFVLLMLTALLIGGADIAAAKSHLRALIIGNDAYQSLPVATASVGNAEEMELALDQLGFDVSLISNGDAITLWQRMAAFTSIAATSGPDAVNVIYFAGRTAVENDQTYLLPIDADPSAGIASRAILLDQIVTLTAAGGSGVFVVLDLAQASEAANIQQGVGPLRTPPKGLVAIIERASGVQPDDETNEAFAITFSDETQLPNLLMGPFIELAAHGAKSYSAGKLTPTFIRGEASAVIVNVEPDQGEVDRILQLRAYDLSRTGSKEKLAAFAALYPDFERSDELLGGVPKSAEEIEDELELLRPVLFSSPLSGAGKSLDGLSISEIIKLKPKHTPIEGLPTSAWEDKSCSDCHKWDQAALCEHGTRYQGDIWNRAKLKSHPLGGSFKRVLRAWAADGCLTE